jgi:hypothetical protein
MNPKIDDPSLPCMSWLSGLGLGKGGRKSIEIQGTTAPSPPPTFSLAVLV